MKKLLSILMLLIVCGYATAHADQDIKTIISGHIDLPKDSIAEVELVIGNSTNRFETSTKLKTKTKDGNFKLEFGLSRIRKVVMYVNGKNVPIAGLAFYLEPGDKLKLQWGKGESQAQQMIASGKGSASFNFARELALLDKTILASQKRIKDINLKDFYDKWDAYQERADGQLELLDNYKSLLSSPLYKIWRAYTIVNTMGFLIALQQDPKSERFRQFYHAKLKDNSYFKEVCNSEIASSLGSTFYLYMLQDYVRLKAAIETGEKFDSVEETKNPWPFYNMLIQQYGLGELGQYVISNRLINLLKTSTVSSMAEQCITNFLSRTKNTSIYHRQLSELFKHYKDNLIAGKILPDFQFKSDDGRIVKLSDFKGKALFIDFNFTGCGGCKDILPELDKVKTYFSANKDVLFISVSIDKSESLWKQSGIGKYTSKDAIQLITMGLGSDHPFIRFLNVQSYPDLAVIDKQGKIVRVHAPDPRIGNGQKELIALIEQAMK